MANHNLTLSMFYPRERPDLDELARGAGMFVADYQSIITLAPLRLRLDTSIREQEALLHGRFVRLVSKADNQLAILHFNAFHAHSDHRDDEPTHNVGRPFSARRPSPFRFRDNWIAALPVLLEYLVCDSNTC